MTLAKWFIDKLLVDHKEVAFYHRRREFLKGAWVESPPLRQMFIFPSKSFVLANCATGVPVLCRFSIFPAKRNRIR